jgi:hypothetical protein
MPPLPVKSDELLGAEEAATSTVDDGLTPEDSELLELSQDPTTVIKNKVAQRMQFFHQQVYYMFIVSLLAAWTGGAFIKQVLIFLWKQILNLLRMIWDIIYAMVSKFVKLVVRGIVACINSIKAKFIKKNTGLQKKKLVRNVSAIEKGLDVKKEDESESNKNDEDSKENDAERLMTQADKDNIERMELEIQATVNEKERQRKEKLLLRFRMQIEKPYWSDNIYLELNIENLTQAYIRS